MQDVTDFVSWLWSNPIQMGDSRTSLSAIATLILNLILVILLAKGIRYFLNQYLLLKLHIDQGNRAAIASISTYGFTTLGFIIVLQIFGFDLASLAVIAGGLGIGIGFGLQDIVKNFISGLTLLLERHIKVGDFLEFDGLAGHVKQISLRSVIFKTLDGGDVVIPNNHLTDNRILNWSLDSFKARIHIHTAVAYGSNPVLVTETLLKAAYQEPAVCHSPPPQVVCLGCRDDPNGAMEFDLVVWVDRIDRKVDISSSLNFLVEYHLRQQGINIPHSDNWLEDMQIHVGDLTQAQERPSARWQFQHPVLQPLTEIPPLHSILRKVVYFKNFTEVELRQLIEVGYRKRISAGEVLFSEGDPGNAFYIILSGTLMVTAEKLNKLLARLGAGEFLGEVALLLGIPRTAKVHAESDSVLFVINKKGFEKLLMHNPDLSEVIVQTFSEHREELQQRKQELLQLGLIEADVNHQSLTDWVRQRVSALFHNQHP